MAMKTKLSRKAAEEREQFPRILFRTYLAADPGTREHICGGILAKAEGDDVSAVRLLRAVESIHAAELRKAREANPIQIQIIYGDELDPKDVAYTREKGREFLLEQSELLAKQQADIEARLAKLSAELPQSGNTQAGEAGNHQ